MIALWEPQKHLVKFPRFPFRETYGFIPPRSVRWANFPFFDGRSIFYGSKVTAIFVGWTHFPLSPLLPVWGTFGILETRVFGGVRHPCTPNKHPGKRPQHQQTHPPNLSKIRCQKTGRNGAFSKTGVDLKRGGPKVVLVAGFGFRTVPVGRWCRMHVWVARVLQVSNRNKTSVSWLTSCREVLLSSFLFVFGQRTVMPGLWPSQHVNLLNA